MATLISLDFFHKGATNKTKYYIVIKDKETNMVIKRCFKTSTPLKVKSSSRYSIKREIHLMYSGLQENKEFIVSIKPVKSKVEL